MIDVQKTKYTVEIIDDPSTLLEEDFNTDLLLEGQYADITEDNRSKKSKEIFV